MVIPTGEIRIDKTQMEAIENQLKMLSLSVENYPIIKKIEGSRGDTSEELIVAVKQLETIRSSFKALIDQTQTYIQNTRITFTESDARIANSIRSNKL